MAEVHTFLFSDLAGFTALTEAEGDERAADVAIAFCSELNRLLPPDAEDLKMLGDGCLVRVGAARDAIELGLALAHGLGPQHGFPDVRVGMHTGTAVRRGDDWFGAGVNISARVVAVAGPRDVLLTAATREAAGPLDRIDLEDRGVHSLRHVSSPVRLYGANAPRTPSHGSP